MNATTDIPRIGPAQNDGSGLDGDDPGFVVTYRWEDAPVDPLLAAAAGMIARRRHTEHAALWAVRRAIARTILQASSLDEAVA